MTNLITTALVGFFVYTGVGSTTLPTWANQKPVEPTYPTYQVTMTGYNAVPSQTDEDPDITASGAYSNPDIIAARSVDLADELPFGTVISIEASATSSAPCGEKLVRDQIGLRVIADSMHPRMHNKVDILFDEADTVKVGGKQTNPARAFGVCKDVRVKVVGHISTTHMPKTQIELLAALGQTSLATK